MTRFSTLMSLLTLVAISGCNSADETTTAPPISEATVEDDSASSNSSEDSENQVADATGSGTTTSAESNSSAESGAPRLETATFGAGCFWCVEAVFELLKGVEKVESGYCNGEVPNPTYEQVCTGETGHAEVIRITYDPSVISYDALLQVFWTSHDPTTLNRQGPDEGTQYRSGVYYHSDEQRALAESYKKKLNEQQVFDSPIVTEIVKADTFYPAEDYHQDYFALNSNNRYCRAVIPPKLAKVRKVFADKLKQPEKK